jgi:hypothetical protein
VVKIRLPFRREKIVLRYRWKSGEEGQIELDEYPEYPAQTVKEILGVEDICENFEWVRIYVGSRVRYSYPCRRKKEEKEDELLKLAKEVLMEELKETLQSIRERKNISPKDVLAQLIAEHKMAIDLYRALKELYEPNVKTSSSSSVEDELGKMFMDLFKMVLMNSITGWIQRPMQQQQPVTQQPHQQPQATPSTSTNIINIINEALKEFSQLPPEERAKVVSEALEKAKEIASNLFRKTES